MSPFTKISVFSIAFATLNSISVIANAASLDADLNNDTLKAKYNFSHKKADLGISAGAMLTDDNGEVYSFDLKTQGQLKNTPDANIRGGFGVRAYHASPKPGDSFQSLGLGGFVELALPNLTLGAELYYAPSVTTSNDIDAVWDIAFRVSYQLFENAAAYVGLRDFEVDVNDQDFNFDEGPHIGFSLQF
ncbi:MAG: hypothetical protein ACI9Y1_000141 [Lentisphaeria bacterium]|jgi:hypothetical protein